MATYRDAALSRLEGLVGQVPRLQLSQAPTPLHRLPRLGADLGIDLFCLRDDLTGFAFGGNKARKLDYLIPEAISLAYDCIVTWGSQQSNWCRSAATAAAVQGLRAHLVLAGPAPTRHTGNLVLNGLVGAEMHFVDGDADAVAADAVELAQRLNARGANPCLMNVGGSSATGALGYASAFREILEFERLNGIQFGTIVVATGSGGTQAGLAAGQLLTEWPGQIVGVTVSRDSPEQLHKVREVLAAMDVNFGLELSGAPLIAEDAYRGAGYGIATDAGREAIELFGRREGIFLDEVYTAKAAAGLIDYARRKRFDRSKPVLFIHTGGAAQLFSSTAHQWASPDAVSQ